MKIFYEKANKEILEECNQFIQNYRDSFADYYIYRKALCLYIKLSQSLLDSQKDFDDAIKKETNKIIALDEGVEKDVAVFKFNQSNYCLVLDSTAHHVLEQLDIIERNNRRKH